MAEAAIDRDALSAWTGLATVGGLEPGGRDSDLADELKNRLEPGADTLESALRTASVDAFVQALFGLVQPFPMMFADVLRFFEKADAREGRCCFPPGTTTVFPPCLWWTSAGFLTQFDHWRVAEAGVTVLTGVGKVHCRAPR